MGTNGMDDQATACDLSLRAALKSSTGRHSCCAHATACSARPQPAPICHPTALPRHPCTHPNQPHIHFEGDDFATQLLDALRHTLQLFLVADVCKREGGTQQTPHAWRSSEGMCRGQTFRRGLNHDVTPIPAAAVRRQQQKHCAAGPLPPLRRRQRRSAPAKATSAPQRAMPIAIQDPMPEKMHLEGHERAQRCARLRSQSRAAAHLPQLAPVSPCAAPVT